tara:strand:+ start:6893 stop:7156 length:264 start_codon:yes stop_codon:yes gene_type:complete
MVQLAGDRPEEPDVYHWHGKRNVTHSLTADFLPSYLYTTSVADDSTVSNSFILAAMALVVLYRTEDFFAEKTFLLRFVGTIIDRLRL